MNNHEIWNELGNLYLLNGAYQSAIHAYLRSIQLNRSFGRPYGNLAMAYAQTGKYQEAIKLYRHSLKLLDDRKEKAATWNRLGILYRQVKDYQKALEAYKQADQLDPKQSETAASLGTRSPLSVSMPAFNLEHLFAEDGQPKATITESAIREEGFIPLDTEKILMGVIVPDESTSLAETGDAQLPEAEAAQAAQETVHEQTPQSRGPVPSLSAEEKQALDQEIAKRLAETQENPRNIVAWEKLSEAYRSAGLYAEAIEAIHQAIAGAPARASFHYLLGFNLAAIRRDEEAIKAFEKVLSLNPNYALAHASLGNLYRKMGQEEKAQIHIKKALGSGFANQHEYNRACMEAIIGNTDRAIDLLQVALQNKQTHVNWVVNDPDLYSLHDDERFISLVSSYTPAPQTASPIPVQ